MPVAPYPGKGAEHECSAWIASRKAPTELWALVQIFAADKYTAQLYACIRPTLTDEALRYCVA